MTRKQERWNLFGFHLSPKSHISFQEGRKPRLLSAIMILYFGLHSNSKGAACRHHDFFLFPTLLKSLSMLQPPLRTPARKNWSPQANKTPKYLWPVQSWEALLPQDFISPTDTSQFWDGLNTFKTWTRDFWSFLPKQGTSQASQLEVYGRGGKSE